ncbi:hypothetical protein NP493_546g02053 [Ridgeia piscesae]|uniref:poly(ADP-ribose) glycohydrolase n=1 Tax=Ridgeia piscesae TaxID=27915 RepID=A0AAD9KX25_RIDPI|nr:hypothetical protein NP493_546g02053 [Ridgeia piscesae]
MAELALELPKLCSQPIPLLKKGMAHSITLSQKQAACLLANAFFCTFPHSNSREDRSPVPGINFSRLYRDGIPQRTREKLKCLLHYFKTVTEHMPQGNITYSRQVLKRHDLPNWETRQDFFPKLRVDSGGTIEDNGEGMLQADFANKYIGGGVLGEGCVQEEIRFVICPELLVSLLFTEVLEKNEAVIITGSQRYSRYKGYATSFEWDGGYEDTIARDNWGRHCTQVTAIDAINVKRDVDCQFEADSMLRELNKAYVGFYDPYNQRHKTAVATGNWGCGAFGGDSRLKALIQLMAAAVAERDVCYFTYKDNKLTQDIYDIHQLITDRRLTVGDVWKFISDYSQTIRGSGGGSSRGGKGVYYSPNVNPHGRGYESASYDHSTRAIGGIRKNMFEFIREKVLPTTTSHGTPSSPADHYGSAGATSHVGSHHGTSESSYDDRHSHSTRPPLQRTSSSHSEEDSHGADDGEEDWKQITTTQSTHI